MSDQPPLDKYAANPLAGESSFLTWVRNRQSAQLKLTPHSHVRRSAGDDLAVLDWPGGLVLLGADPVVDGVHLEIARHGPAAAGRKAVNRNLSDVAAMAGEPLAATLSLVVPRSMSMAGVQAIYLAAEEAGALAKCPIVGGDFASWDGRLVITVGILARADTPVLRAAATPGQTLFVTGALGGSILGRHLTFSPRLELGRRIGREFGATAMIDISDGLSRDLPRLLGDSLGATIDAAAVPIHEDAVRLSRNSGRDPLWHALHDGEDYELLFTASATSLPGCIAIGRVESKPGARVMRGGTSEPLGPEGWEHRLSGERSR